MSRTSTPTPLSSRASFKLGGNHSEQNLDFLKWGVEQVADWLEQELGFTQYRPCFTDNLINGRKLIFVTAANLPKLGVNDFSHIQAITKAVRNLIGIDAPDSLQSIANPRCGRLEAFLERKSQTGQMADILEYKPSPPDSSTLTGVRRGSQASKV